MTLAAEPGAMPFSGEEQAMYAAMRANSTLAGAMFNLMAVRSFAEDYERSLIQVARSPVPLRTSTTPVLSMPASANPAMDLPLPRMTPFQRVLAPDPHTLISVVEGNFGATLAHCELSADEARGFNRAVCHQLTCSTKVRHMLCGRGELDEDMT